MDDANALPGRTLAERLDRCPASRAWGLIVCAVLALVGINHACPDVGMGPLYIPLIAAVGWRFGLIASCALAVLATCLNIFPLHVQEVGLSTGVLAARGALRFGTYAFVVCIVHSFRRAYDRERAGARLDRMTGALNRTAFDHHADRLLAAAGRDKSRRLLVAIMDLDDFKAINDVNGHAAGDLVLRAFASAALALLRKEDALGRIGGDEFALIVPLPDGDDGHAVADRFHRKIAAALRATSYPATFSMGALVADTAHAPTRKDLMREADRRLYGVKAQGKGGFCVAKSPSDAAPVIHPSIAA